MNFDLRRPCSDCPFLREGGIRLRPSRVREIAGQMLRPDGRTFTCHKTAGAKVEQHCAGALIFAERHGNATQLMRIAERFGRYDYTKLEGADGVFATFEEMLETAI